MMRILIFLLLTFSSSLLLNASQDDAKGLVYWDKNKNHVFDNTDERLQGIAVSSLDSIVLTNHDGTFSLPIQSNDIVFVIQPDSFQSPLQESGIPCFYKICYSKPSDKNLFYKGIEKKTFDKDSLYFPLEKIESPKQVKAFMVGDIQAPTSKEVEFFQELILPELLKYDADFNVFLGDLADNYLDIYPDIISALSPVESPLYMVFGNHDTNYRSKDFNSQSETYRKFFGPDYYSFNRGNTHFIVLNTIVYQGWNNNENRRGRYTGGIYPQQFNWLKKNLQLVPYDRRIVLMAHIPLYQGFCDTAILEKVFSLLLPYKEINSIYGHAHVNQSWVYSDTTFWNGEGAFTGHVAGAACGAWWVGPYGPDSIPDATCMDGSPAGVYLYEFGADKTEKTFIPGGKYPDYQLRFSSPAASITVDSLQKDAIYVNVFDGNDQTVVECSIDNGPWIQMKKSLEFDPFIVRNHKRRSNRNNWIPGYQPSGHLWKTHYPETLTPGRHMLKARCWLNGKEYSTLKIVNIISDK